MIGPESDRSRRTRRPVISSSERNLDANVLVTGAGGPAAVSFMNAVADSGVRIWAVDIDPYAAGLYLTEPGRSALVPRGDADDFVDHVLELCRRWSIDVLVPTVDVEMLPIVRRSGDFAGSGTTILAPSVHTLETCLDKWTLIEHCRGAAELPATVVFDESFEPTEVSWPAVAKPRQGSGSRGVRLVSSVAGLGDLPRDGSYIVQQLLPGIEHSLDVLGYRDGTIVAVVPRTRLKVDSGIAVAGSVEVDDTLMDYGFRIAKAVSLTSVANVQVKQDEHGEPRLLEVNPRFPGSMPLTVASGVNMPLLALADALGHDVPREQSFRPLAMVRTWTETFFEPEEFLT